MELEASLKDFDRASDALSRNRGLAFLAFLVPAIVGLVRGYPRWGWALTAVPALGFGYLVVRHLLLASKRLSVEDRLGVVSRGLARLESTPFAKKVDAKTDDVPRGPDPFGERFAKADHPNAGDLDLFGKTSLFRALSRAETSIGEETVAKWLLDPPSTVAETIARQEAAKELMSKPELLEELAVRARRAESRGRAEDPLVAWAEAPAELPVSDDAPEIAKKRAPIVLIARILVPLTLLSFFASPFLASIKPFLGRAYLAPFGLQLVALGLLFAPISRMVSFVSSRESPFGRFGGLFELVETTELSSPLLKELQKTLRGESASAATPKASLEIARLERIVGFADLRHNTLIHIVANLGLLYDVWCALALERWRSRSGRKVRKWLRAVGTLEALASLATFAAEHPSFAWPEIVDGEPFFEVESLGHPLISSPKRVVNSLSLEEPGRAILVTGSNMSGKSTWLRSMGLCAVMANAGSVVCAKRARLGRMSVWTSMRIRDSLEQGISHFYAELLRLKAVQDAVHQDHRVLFLLDEILHGTNSRERTLGARSVVLDLTQRGAIGAVSSHDLGLVGLESESHGKIANKHFSDRIEGGTMTFDYRLQEGVVRSTNALRLMRLVGLEVGMESEPAETPATIDAE